MENFVFTEWQPGYSVGNAGIDAQHRKMFELCKLAIEALEDDSQQSKTRCFVRLSDLASFVAEHYKSEEALLASCNYPLLETHQEEHVLTMQKFHNFLMSAYRGQINKTQLSTFLSEWAADHILGSDKQYVQSINRV